MSDLKAEQGNIDLRRDAADTAGARAGWLASRPRHDRIVPILLTLLALLAAAAVAWEAWEAYMGAPWTRDGRVRAYTVIIAPEVAGTIVEMPVKDNQFVRKGEELMVIDPKTYAIAVASAQAQVEQAKFEMDNKIAMAKRREQLTTLSTSAEEQQTYTAQALAATAAYNQAVANLAKAKVDLERTRIVSPVNGWVTNLLWQLGDYADVGERKISIVNADSFWVDGYFEETALQRIHVGDPVRIKLMGFDQVLRGHVDDIAHGITVDNAQPGSGGLATVNPVFTWVRLAQRIPVRIHLDEIPPGVVLAAGQTATVQIDPQPQPQPQPQTQPQPQNPKPSQ